MSGPLTDAVVAAVQKILEVSAFELADVVEVGPPPAAAITARLAFHGPHHGAMHLWIEPGEARAFACATLGIEDPDADAVDDAVRELANMICGHVLSETYSDECIALDRAELAAPPLAAYGVQFAGEHGGIGVTVEVAS